MSKSQKGKKKSEEHKKKLSGENSGRAKLNWAMVQEIRTKHATKNYNYKNLAKRYNVDSTTISNIINNRSWKK